LRMSGRDNPIRHRVIWVIEADLNRRLDVGTEHHVSSGIGLDASAARRFLNIECPTPSDVGVLDDGPTHMYFLGIDADHYRGGSEDRGGYQQGGHGGSDPPHWAEIGPHGEQNRQGEQTREQPPADGNGESLTEQHGGNLRVRSQLHRCAADTISQALGCDHEAELQQRGSPEMKGLNRGRNAETVLEALRGSDRSG